MASITATAIANETLDALVWRTLGRTMGMVEATLNRNPGLAALGPLLPEGTPVQVPMPDTATVTLDLVQLWS